jgi:S-(hydroxymethyl)glutathione dehydrogenase/alcohol dehydrogenase
MKAAVCYEFNKPLVIEELEIDKPRKGEVKVRIAATAVCHSDIHFINGDLGGKVPFVPGHESSGYIEELGDGVTSVKVGDPVVVSLLRSCGECLYCRTGRPNMCEAKWPLDTDSRLRNKKGQAVGHGIRVVCHGRPVSGGADTGQYADGPGGPPGVRRDHGVRGGG